VIEKGPQQGRAGVVDEDVHGPERVDRRCDEPRDAVLVRDVHRNGDRLGLVALA
jgi:hypothetical protein